MRLLLSLLPDGPVPSYLRLRLVPWGGRPWARVEAGNALWDRKGSSPCRCAEKFLAIPPGTRFRRIRTPHRPASVPQDRSCPGRLPGCGELPPSACRQSSLSSSCSLFDLTRLMRVKICFDETAQEWRVRTRMRTSGFTTSGG